MERNNNEPIPPPDAPINPVAHDDMINSEETTDSSSFSFSIDSIVKAFWKAFSEQGDDGLSWNQTL